MKKNSRRVATLGLVVALVLGSAVVAAADDHTGPPPHVLEKAKAAVGQGQERALEMLALAATRNPDTGMPDHAKGQPGHATGLERAQEAVSKAADKVKGYEKDNPGEGNAYGHGRAAEVHAALAAGISPSTLESHGEKVSAMVKAVESLTEEKPGRGVGRNNRNDDDGE
jgi:hypothetical protein